jgi:hypothetical protein
MDPNEVIGNISITNTVLEKILDNVIDSSFKNNSSMRRLFFDLIYHNQSACEWLLKMYMGEEYPDLPVGTLGYIKVSALDWSAFKDHYIASEHVKHGFIPCVVIGLKGLDRYNPLSVRLPPVTVNGETIVGMVDTELRNFYLKPPASSIIDTNSLTVDLDI